jgi:hypothetical protein
MPNIPVWTTSGGLQHSQHVNPPRDPGGMILRNPGSIPSESRQIGAASVHPLAISVRTKLFT